ncbi:hypothetical protein GM921_06415 [Pedobacter sp. LMG 31464]|uniref:Uncharacterized protein n=1 Tax=Pedobacter planticolens TaxID=2679964 RepID=A0A923IWE9_9SPHI|nr:hypothetical protein [Pedobacter planticolens]MBB2145107.1 hypothetical protein [Pedobacter planticolens]
MVKIDYLCELFDNQLPYLYTLLQLDVNDVFCVCIGDQLVGTIKKVTNGWEQIGGREMSNEFIADIGKFIECKFLNASLENVKETLITSH